MLSCRIVLALVSFSLPLHGMLSPDSKVRAASTAEMKAQVATLADIDKPQFPKGVQGIVKSYEKFNPWDYVEAFAEHNGIKSHILLKFDDIAKLIQFADGRFVTGIQSGKIRLWDIAATYASAVNFLGHSGSILAMMQLADGRLVTSAEDRTVKIWDIPTRKCLATLKLLYKIELMIQLADGRIAFTGYDAHDIDLWDLTTNEHVKLRPGYSIGRISALIQLADGKIVSCSDNGDISIFDVSAKKCVARYKSHEDSILSIIQLKDGRIAFCSRDKTIRIWDITDLDRPVCTAIFEDTDSVESIIQISDNRIASSTGHQTIKIWDLVTGKSVASLKHKDHSIVKSFMLLAHNKIAVCVSPYESEDDEIVIWEIDDEQLKIVNRGLQEVPVELVSVSTPATKK
jgi:WD40 repeat protein